MATPEPRSNRKPCWSLLLLPLLVTCAGFRNVVGIRSLTTTSPPASPARSTPQQMDVWVIAGQSNAVGENALDGTPMPQPCATPLRGQLLMYPMTTRAWTDALPNVASISNGKVIHSAIGPEMNFGRSLIAAGLSQVVGLVPTAMGSTSLAADWMPPSGLYWRHMVTAVRGAMAAAAADGRAAQLQGIIWVQGEDDAFHLASAQAYPSNFKTFLSALRAATQPYHPQLPVLMAVMATAHRSVGFPFISTVRQAQLGLINDTDAPGLVQVDMEGLPFYPQDMSRAPSQWIHLTKQGQCSLGANMAAAWRASGLQQRPALAATNATQSSPPGNQTTVSSLAMRWTKSTHISSRARTWHTLT